MIIILFKEKVYSVKYRNFYITNGLIMIGKLISFVTQPLVDFAHFYWGVRPSEKTKEQAKKDSEIDLLGTYKLPEKVEAAVRKAITTLGYKCDDIVLCQKPATTKASSSGSLKHWNFAVLTFSPKMVEDMQTHLKEDDKLRIDHCFFIARELAYLQYDGHNEAKAICKQMKAKGGLATYISTAALIVYTAHFYAFPLSYPFLLGYHLCACKVSSTVKSYIEHWQHVVLEGRVDGRVALKDPKLAQVGMKVLSAEMAVNKSLRKEGLLVIKAMQKKFPDSHLLNIASRLFEIAINTIITKDGDDQTVPITHTNRIINFHFLSTRSTLKAENA